jgi:hypothetical protein
VKTRDFQVIFYKFPGKLYKKVYNLHPNLNLVAVLVKGQRKICANFVDKRL